MAHRQDPLPVRHEVPGLKSQQAPCFSIRALWMLRLNAAWSMTMMQPMLRTVKIRRKETPRDGA